MYNVLVLSLFFRLTDGLFSSNLFDRSPLRQPSWENDGEGSNMVSLVIVSEYNKMKQLVRDRAKKLRDANGLPEKALPFPSTALVNTVHKDPHTKSPRTMVVVQIATVVDSPMAFPPRLPPENDFHHPVTSKRHL